jgi:hypothetical protein
MHIWHRPLAAKKMANNLADAGERCRNIRYSVDYIDNVPDSGNL